MKAPDRDDQKYGVSVKVGLAASWYGMSSIYFFNKWNGAAYVQWCREKLVPYKNRYYHSERIHLVQDNDPSHLTKAAKEYFRRSGFLFEEKYKFCSNSGDLNIVENIWGLILENMEDKDTSSLPKLKHAILDAARAIPKEHVQHMVTSMPRRIQACIEVEGGRTKY